MLSGYTVDPHKRETGVRPTHRSVPHAQLGSGRGEFGDARVNSSVSTEWKRSNQHGRRDATIRYAL